MASDTERSRSDAGEASSRVRYASMASSRTGSTASIVCRGVKKQRITFTVVHYG